MPRALINPTDLSQHPVLAKRVMHPAPALLAGYTVKVVDSNTNDIITMKVVDQLTDNASLSGVMAVELDKNGHKVHGHIYRIYPKHIVTYDKPLQKKETQ